MNRRVLVTMLWKDIRQLDLMTEGFLIINEYPEEVIQMVYQKTLEIQTHLQNLSLYKEDIQDIRLPGEPEEQHVEVPSVSVEEFVDQELEASLEMIADDELTVMNENEFETISLADDEQVELIVDELEHERVESDFFALADHVLDAEDVDAQQEVEESVEFDVALVADDIVADEQEEMQPVEILSFEQENSVDNDSELEFDGSLEAPTKMVSLTNEDENNHELTPDEEQLLEVEEESAKVDEMKDDDAPVVEVENVEEETMLDEIAIPVVVQNGNLVFPGFDEVPMESVTNDSKIIEDGVPTFQPSLFATVAEQSQVFGVENRRITDVKKAISIGERFRFQRELFNGNGEDMNKTLTYINHAVTLAEAMDFLEKKYKWERYNESAADFYRIIKRRFI